MRHSLILGAAILASAACSDGAPSGKHGPASLDHSGLAPVEVAGRVVHESDLLGIPTGLAVAGPYLAVIDDGADSAVHVLRSADGALVRSLGRQGEGPGEYKGAWSIDPVPGKPEEFWVYDLSLRRITHVDLERHHAAPGSRVDTRVLKLSSGSTLTGPMWIGDTVVSPGFFVDGRLARFDTDGLPLGTVGDLPPGGDRVPPTVRQEAYLATPATNGARTLIALGMEYADLIDVLRPDGSLVRRIRGPFGFDPRFTVARGAHGPIMSSGDDMRMGYVHTAATDEYVYALFSGRTREGYGEDSAFGEYVHVYDWDGHLVRVLHLDAALLTIAVDPENATLYGVRHDPKPAVVAYPLAGALGLRGPVASAAQP
ncbi:MAG TPA: BF3164 family lipoprotein [Longimicrobiaceae bacterium]|nr:BF3164 family lipoprotein [Longimicrobiaceae bacterium]